MNPLLQGLTSKTNGLQMLKMFKSNPQQAVMQMMNNNPKMQEVNALIKQYGSPEQAFRHKAQEMGVDPDEIIKAMRNA